MPTASPMPSSPRRRAVLLRLLVGSLTLLVLLGVGRVNAAAAPISISEHVSWRAAPPLGMKRSLRLDRLCVCGVSGAGRVGRGVPNP